MSDEPNIRGTETTTRRDLVKKSAQVAVTAPAVVMLLDASTKRAFAQISAYAATSMHILDDFTFGNNAEDIDNSAALSARGIPTPSQDDHR
jgi:hypothetical protein